MEWAWRSWDWKPHTAMNGLPVIKYHKQLTLYPATDPHRHTKDDKGSKKNKYKLAPQHVLSFFNWEAEAPAAVRIPG